MFAGQRAPKTPKPQPRVKYYRNRYNPPGQQATDFLGNRESPPLVDGLRKHRGAKPQSQDRHLRPPQTPDDHFTAVLLGIGLQEHGAPIVAGLVLPLEHGALLVGIG
jgi:hypothetical protein